MKLSSPIFKLLLLKRTTMFVHLIYITIRQLVQITQVLASDGTSPVNRCSGFVAIPQDQFWKVSRRVWCEATWQVGSPSHHRRSRDHVTWNRARQSAVCWGWSVYILYLWCLLIQKVVGNRIYGYLYWNVVQTQTEKMSMLMFLSITANVRADCSGFIVILVTAM